MLSENGKFSSRSLRMFWLLCCFVLGGQAAAQQDIDELIRQRLEAPTQPYAGGEPLYNVAVMLQVYQARGFQPIWLNGRQPDSKAFALLNALGESRADAMQPEDYHLGLVSGVVASLNENASPAALVDLELALSDMFLAFAGHSLRGRINPNTIDAEWFATPRDESLAALLTKAAEQNNVAGLLTPLQPPQPGYQRLKQALAEHREIASRGGWSKVSPGPAMKPGEQDARLPEVRARLGLPAPSGEPDRYDAVLEASVKRFQRLHGLDADGVIGKATLAALNQSAAEKARIIELNMERWRWLPQQLGERHVRVNIAGFELESWENGGIVDTQAVVVGRDYRRTPVFSGTMTYLVLNPTWEVPPSIAQKDLLPQIQKDPAYLERMRFQVLREWGAEEKRVDPATVDWNSLKPSSLPYRFRQLPGENNALGQVKLMFPNPHAVYLHDTPAKNLFGKTDRAFSSGCIRLQRPLDLAAWALTGTAGWDRPRIDAAVAAGRTETVRLGKPVQVHLLYWTAWVSPDGDVHFRRDIYGRDARLRQAIDLPPPQ